MSPTTLDHKMQELQQRLGLDAAPAWAPYYRDEAAQVQSGIVITFPVRMGALNAVIETVFPNSGMKLHAPKKQRLIIFEFEIEADPPPAEEAEETPAEETDDGEQHITG